MLFVIGFFCVYVFLFSLFFWWQIKNAPLIDEDDFKNDK